jgi:hypothetical protein
MAEMARPPLTKRLPVEDFRSFYWLKAELLEFCRAAGLPTAGSKQALAARIEAWLSTGRASAPGNAGDRAAV